MFDIAGQTHVGLVRKENQDGFLAVRLAAGDRQYACLVVADGMGGHLDGRLASETAIKTVKSHLNAPTIATPTTPNGGWRRSSRRRTARWANWATARSWAPP